MGHSFPEKPQAVSMEILKQHDTFETPAWPQHGRRSASGRASGNPGLATARPSQRVFRLETIEDYFWVCFQRFQHACSGSCTHPRFDALEIEVSRVPSRSLSAPNHPGFPLFDASVQFHGHTSDAQAALQHHQWFPRSDAIHATMGSCLLPVVESSAVAIAIRSVLEDCSPHSETLVCSASRIVVAVVQFRMEVVEDLIVGTIGALAIRALRRALFSTPEQKHASRVSFLGHRMRVRAVRPGYARCEARSKYIFGA